MAGRWRLLDTALHPAERERVGRNPDPDGTIMDSQSVMTVKESACIHEYDAHKRVKGQQRHSLADTLGLLITSYVTPADAHDTVSAQVPRRTRMLRAASQEVLGGCHVPRQRAGQLVSAARRGLGVGGRGTSAGLTRLPRATTPLGRGTTFHLVYTQSAAGQGRRALYAGERVTQRGDGHPPCASPLCHVG